MRKFAAQKFGAGVFSGTCLLLGLSASAQFKYDVTDTGDFLPQAVSPSGVVAGALPTYTPGTSSPDSILATYANGRVQPLGQVIVPKDNRFFDTISVVNITASGKVALTVSAITNFLGRGDVPVIYDGAFHPIPGAASTSRLPGSWGVNDSGYVAGHYNSTSSFTSDGMTTTTVPAITIGLPNSAGQSAAKVQPDPRLLPQFGIYQNGTFTQTIDNSTGNLRNLVSVGEINDAGTILGTYLDSNHVQEPVIIRNGVPTFLSAVISGQATTMLSLTSAGLLVGSYTLNASQGPATHAAIYDGVTLHDLNTDIDPTSGWTLTSAVSMSDNGIIVGEGIHNGVSAGFILTSVTPDLQPMPEPTAAFGIGSAATIILARRRRKN